MGTLGFRTVHFFHGEQHKLTEVYEIYTTSSIALDRKTPRLKVNRIVYFLECSVNDDDGCGYTISL